MNEILCQQLAIDYCCSSEDVLDERNHFTVHKFLDGRRRFQEGTDCFLKIAIINGKVLFSGQNEIISWCKERYWNTDGEWFFEAKNLRALNDKLHERGYQIEAVHPFFIPVRKGQAGTPPRVVGNCRKAQYPVRLAAEVLTSGTMPIASEKEYDICWYHENEIEQFRGDTRYGEAFAFCEDAPDVIGVAALEGGEILGMAGASCDSPAMWQIGINVDPNKKGSGIGTMLVTLLAKELLGKGILPYYGTSMSHIASQRVALGAGFVPAWAELATSRQGY